MPSLYLLSLPAVLVCVHKRGINAPGKTRVYWHFQKHQEPTDAEEQPTVDISVASFVAWKRSQKGNYKSKYIPSSYVVPIYLVIDALRLGQ